MICMAMQTCQEYARKRETNTLNEFELECYETCARAVSEFMRIRQIEARIAMRQFKIDHPELMKEEEDGEYSP